jgi:hypothetical protein
VGDSAILLPSAVLQWLEDVQPRLSRLGVRLVDQSGSIIDPERLELVVPEPTVQVNEIALARIPEPGASRSELPRVEPGRYPLRAWAMSEGDDYDGPLSRARAVAASLPTVKGKPEELDSMLQQIGALIERVDPIPLYFESPADLVDGLKEPLAALR